MKRLLCLVLCLPLAVAAAEKKDRDPIAVLQHFHQGLDNLQADFRQLLYDDKGTVVRRSRGRFLLQRPGRFRWDYHAPYRQTIVGDGSTLSVYDSDLAQLTLYRQQQALATAPIMLLGERSPLSQAFRLQALPPSVAGHLRVKLEPLADDSDFRSIVLELDGMGILLMELRDSFDLLTRIYFDKRNHGGVIAAENFVMVPAAGVEIVDQRQ